MRLLTDTLAAEELGLSVSTLRSWRYNGRGPAWVKVGRSVRYRPDDLLAFIEGGVVQPEGGNG